MARAPLAAEIEASPEADRLDGFPHPRETAKVIGHAGAELTFESGLASDVMHHAWLVTGVAGCGKATLAYRVARAALARPDEKGLFGAGLDVDEHSPTTRQIAAQAHPALLVIRRAYDQKAKRFSASIAVDEVRRLKNFLALSAEDGGRRVVIVDSADELNVNAANALLKSLEEPPSRTLFLILSSAPGRLLPTIRSRCRTLALAPLSAADLRQAVTAALEAAGKPLPDGADWLRLESISGGSARRALALLEGGGLALQARIDRLLADLPKLDVKSAHQLGDEMQGAAQESKFTLYFDLLQDALARLIRAEATGQGSASDRALAARLIGPARLATFAELWETLARARADAQALNLDRKALILASLTRLEAASRG
ncbi:MAG: DNA polymerase III subunit delta' [Hyphomicrobium sp.]